MKPIADIASTHGRETDAAESAAGGTPSCDERCRRNQTLEALFEVSQAMTSSFELDRNLRRALRALSARLGLNRATITVVDPDTRQLRIAASHGLTRSQAMRGTYRVGEGVVGQVVATGRPMAVPNIAKEPLFLNRTQSRLDKNDVAFICVPVKLRGELLGVLSADRLFDDGDASLAEDLRVLEIVASTMAHSISLYHAYMRERAQKERLRGELRGRYSLPNIIGDSDEMQRVFRMVNKVAASNATVLLRGESGTGKELIANALHYQGLRPKGPLIAINCAALPENLLEAELFGYQKGAFTGAVANKEGRFELARGGTIFLDEIGDVSPALQAKLLRVLQEGTFERLGGTKTLTTDARVISATNRDLEAMVERGEFRDDLYWRLNVVPIFLPPLRDRREDVPLLIEFFVDRFARQSGLEISISDDAMRYLMGYHWPGNIRELENTIQRLIVLAEDDRIDATELPRHILMHDIEEPRGHGLALEEEVEMLERARIVAALRENGYVQAKAARVLGITPRQLGYKVAKYDIESG
jgi:Nif-specific regulatory protein